jgi:hypothetical protein
MIGDSYGLLLLKEILDGLGVRESGVLSSVQTLDRSFLMPSDPDFEVAMGIMRQYRNVLLERVRR